MCRLKNITILDSNELAFFSNINRKRSKNSDMETSRQLKMKDLDVLTLEETFLKQWTQIKVSGGFVDRALGFSSAAIF